MLLAFNISDLIRIPFGYVLDWLYQFTTNYGLALILFTVVVKLVLYPIQVKSKKSMMKMSRITPRVQAIQEKYANDQQKQSEMLQQLYKDEGVSMTGGCLWSFVPLLILLPLYQVIRQPIVYMLHESSDVANQIVEIIKTANPDLFSSNNYYDQVTAIKYIAEYADAIREAIPTVAERTLEGLNMTFLGIDLGSIAQFNVFKWETFDWAHIGLFLIPVLSAGSQVLSMVISQKMNNSVITNEKGIQDKEAAAKSQQAQSSKMMMWMMPLMSLWIGFTIPAALSLYWFLSGVLGIIQEVYLTTKFRKIYDAEDAERLKKALEQDAIEAEKERIRAEKRAANPDGITENTSKKKLQKKQQAEAAAAKAAAAKEYAAKKGIVEEDDEENQTLSGIADRPYCKGRAYDPNRYDHTEE